MIGSVNLALGQKMSREMIREGADYAYVELVFQVNPDTEEKLKKLEVFPEEGQVIISRRFTENSMNISLFCTQTNRWKFWMLTDRLRLKMKNKK